MYLVVNLVFPISVLELEFLSDFDIFRSLPGPGSVNVWGGDAPKIFFLKRTSEPCKRENFARKK